VQKVTDFAAPLFEGDVLPWSLLAEQGQQRLGTATFEVGPTEARWMAEEASGITSAEWHTRNSEPATQRGVAAFDSMFARRFGGEPIQYVLGRWAFRSLDLLVDRRVLIPRPETELLVDLALDALRTMPVVSPVIVDLGTGSGAIALSIAVEVPTAKVIATDVSAAALTVARANLAGTGTAATRVSLYEGSWFGALPDQLTGTFDLVLANPPYISEADPLPDAVREWEPEGALIAGQHGIECVEQILSEALRWLGPLGTAIVEMAPDQTEQAVELALLSGYGTVRIENDLTGRPRFVVASIQ